MLRLWAFTSTSLLIWFCGHALWLHEDDVPIEVKPITSIDASDLDGNIKVEREAWLLKAKPFQVLLDETKRENATLKLQLAALKSKVEKTPFQPWRSEIEEKAHPEKRNLSLGETLLMRGPQRWLETWAETNQNWNQLDEKGRTPLMRAVEHSPLNIVKWVWEQSFHRDHIDHRGRSLLHYAVKGQLDVLRWLLTQNIDVDHRDQSGSTSLHLAVELGRVDAVNVLLAHGADALLTDENNMIPLHLAAKLGNLELVGVLPEPEAFSWVRTPLALSIVHGHLDVAMKLLKDHDQLLELDASGSSLLHLAVRSEHADLVQWLISKGSTLGLKDADGRSPLHLAVEQGHVEIVKILHRQGSPLNSTDLLGRTPLHCAEVFGQKSIAQYLEGWGADLDMIDEAGMSVRDWRNKLLK